MTQQRDGSKWVGWWIDLAGLAIVLAASVAFGLAGVRPLIQKRAEFREQSVDLNQRRQEASNLGASLSREKRHLVQIRQDLDQIPLKLSNAKRLNQRLAEITDMASACGLEIDTMQPGKQQRFDRFERIGIFVAGTGTYQTFTQFLHKLNLGFHDTTVTSFTLNRVVKADRNARFRFDLQWYVEPS